MLLIKENFDIWYNEYKEQYKRTTKYVKSRKGKLRDTTPLTRKEFEIDFRSMVTDNPKKSGTQIAKMMAKQELYTTSWSQAERLAKAHAAEFGGDVNLALIQQYRMESRQEIFGTIKQLRHRMSAEGFDSGAIRLIVAQEFFGSE